MANNTTIQLKRTGTAGAVPTNLLANAELGYNLTDKRLFTTDTTGGAVFDAFQNTASNIAITGTTVQISVGNSTINMISNSSLLKVQNSTVSSLISIQNVVTTNVYASFLATGNIVAASQLGSGANSTNFLRGDLTFAVPTATAAPGGSNTQVQFNDSGGMAGSAGFVFDKTTNNVTIANNLFVNTKLNVGLETGYAFATLAFAEFNDNQNTYTQAVIQNANTGLNASGDLVITTDTGNDSVQYLDIGINSSTYNNTSHNIVGALDAYIYTSNNHLAIGTAAAKEIIFHANGTTSADRKMTINATAITVNSIPLIVGNSTVNSTVNSTAVQITNSTTNSVLSPSLLTIGNSTVYGSFNNTTLLIASNSTVNSIITDASVTVQNSTSIAILNPITVKMGNSTVNAALISQALTMYHGNTTLGSDAATPAANNVTIFGKYTATKIIPAYVEGSAGLSQRLMSHLLHNPMSYLLPIPNGTTISALRATSANTVAFTARTPTTANAFLSASRVSQTTGATAGTSVSWRNSVTQWWRGNAAGLGGFYAVTRFGVATTTTNGRGFIGFKDSATILTNNAPSAQTNIIGFGFDSSNSTVNTLRVMSANSTAANTIDLGSGFPVNTGNTDWYEAVIYSPPNGGTVAYQVTNLKNGNTVSGTFNQTNLPTTTTLLTWQFWGNNGADAAALVMDWGGVTIETGF